VTYEQTGPSTKSSIKSLADDLARGYKPTRYNGITDSPAPNNALKNSLFDVWADSSPVWWEPTRGDWWTSVVGRRKDVYRTSRNSLELFNRSNDPRTFTELSQTASVSVGTSYTLAVWARTGDDPRGLEVRLRYIDADGRDLGEVRTDGAVWALNDSAFKRMALTAVAPTGTVNAVVTMRLAGGGSAESTAGTSAILDDVSLAGPQATVSIRTSKTAVYRGNWVTLSGSSTPTATIGRPFTVYVRKPGASLWGYASKGAVSSLSGAPAWRYNYLFRSGVTKGVYGFRTDVPALPGYFGASSPIMSVRVK
jgi:hypothetical protein